MISSAAGFNTRAISRSGQPDVGNMVQHAVAEHLVESIVGIGDGQRAALLQLVIGQLAQLQPGAQPRHGFRGEVEARPARPAADDLLRIGALTEANLEQLRAAEVDAVEAAQDVAFAAVAQGIVLPELLVIAAEGLTEAADLLVAARMGLPECLNLRFVHGFPPSKAGPTSSRMGFRIELQFGRFGKIHIAIYRIRAGLNCLFPSPPA